MLFVHQPGNSLPNRYNACLYDNVQWRMHFHRNLEIICVLSGEVLCSLRGEKIILREGEFAFCPSNEPHAYHSLKDSKSWVIVFSEDLVPSFAKTLKDKQGNQFSFTCDKATYAYLLEHFLSRTQHSPMQLKAGLYTLCNAYLERVTLSPREQKNDLLLENILQYVSKHYTENITLSSVAESLNYSYHYISRVFKKNLSMSFSDYVNIYRLEHALLLLHSSNKKMTEIAFESGFQSLRNFNHVFHESFSVSPKQYTVKYR